VAHVIKNKVETRRLRRIEYEQLVGSSRVSQPEEAGEGARSQGVRDFMAVQNVAM
jgi:hypothetical protein